MGRLTRTREPFRSRLLIGCRRLTCIITHQTKREINYRINEMSRPIKLGGTSQEVIGNR